ncbi:MAG: hypothetical protein K8I03_04910 [Ignavibacteria bacterium]|nr:hypothetical protein [Ignavibacteria bacterium]
MKTIKIFLAGLFILTAFSVYSQDTKVIAVINKASWCPVCKSNGEKVMMLMKEYMGKDITFIENDLTDENSKKESAKSLEQNGVSELLKDNENTGIITIINNENKKVIETISVNLSAEDIKSALNSSLSLR